MIEVRCQSGLCNRLRVLFSWREYARERKQQLTMVWPKFRACDERFDNLFAPVPGVTFEYEDRTGSFAHNGWQICRKGNRHIAFNYRDLIPIKEILDHVAWRQQWLGNKYVAVHIRRTDHLKYAAAAHFRPTPDEDFVAFLDRYRTAKIYLATDDFETYSKFKIRFGDRLAPPQAFKPPEQVNLRTTTIQDAVADIWLCRGASQFMGSFGSSFSKLIVALRREDRT